MEVSPCQGKTQPQKKRVRAMTHQTRKTITEMLGAHFPDCRVHTEERRVGDAIWEWRTTLAGATMLCETIRGRNKSSREIRLRGGKNTRAPIGQDTEEWEKTVIETLKQWLKSGEADKEAAWMGLPQKPLQMETITAWRQTLKTTLQLLHKQGIQASLTISSPETTQTGEMTHTGAGTFLVWSLNELPGNNNEPCAMLSIWGKTKKLPAHPCAIQAEEIAAEILQEAKNSTAGKALLGEKPWENWKLEKAKATFEPIDEWLCTNVTLTIRCPHEDTPNPNSAWQWLQNAKESLRDALPKCPQYQGEDHGEVGIDCPHKGVQYPNPFQVVADAKTNAIEVEKLGEGSWALRIEESNR
jgi:hypothetical protein